MNPISNQPIHDISPPNDSLGNPEAYAHVPVRQAPGAPAVQPTNPITASGAHAAQTPQPAAQHADKLDKDLKEVNKAVKAAGQKPHQPSKPVLAITTAIAVALVLSAAAVFAFRSS